MRFIHKTLPSFWHSYFELPEVVRRRSDKQFELLTSDPSVVSIETGPFWSVRVSDGYRALSIRQENTFVWFSIGNHDDYERLLKG